MKRALSAVVLAAALTACTGTPEPTLPAPTPIPPKEYPVNEPYTVLSDRVVQGSDKEGIALNGTTLKTTYYPGERTWTLKQDISQFPQFSAPEMPLLEAVYNLSLEEALRNINNKGLLMAGEKWTGTWTRDISYAIHLSLGSILPQASMDSLKFKVNPQEQVIQDTGTGGSWPVSTDRVVWAIAAWEIYKTTGDRSWLDYSYRVLKNTANRDLATVVDPFTGLYLGESSFMDWRDQSYAKWMEPKDIYESKALGTNVLHQQLLSILGQMAKELGKPAAEAAAWTARGDKLREAINAQLWLQDKGYFSIYQYPEVMGRPLSDKTETLGNALAVWFGVADKNRSAQIMTNLPVVPFGPPILYPQHAHANPYHNKAIWPFVTAYYALAGKKTGQEGAAAFGLKSNLRVAALYLTNKENLTWDTGKDSGTAINSNRQLWSVGGQIAGYYRILFGLDPQIDGLRFAPLVPDFVKGPLELKGYPYRGAKVNVKVSGQGSQVASLKVEGVEKGPAYVLLPSVQGEVNVEILLTSPFPTPSVTYAPLTVGPRDPVALTLKDRQLTWRPQPGVAQTGVFKNAKPAGLAQGGTWTDPQPTSGLYYLQSVDEEGIKGNLSDYVTNLLTVTVPADAGVIPPGSREPDGDKNRVTLAKGQGLTLDLNLPQEGKWALSWVYANDNGPISTDNKCALRTLLVDGKAAGTHIFPQRGGGERYGDSNTLILPLKAGAHKVELAFLPDNENMNIEVNEASLVQLEARLLP